jgi:hypothetical protein
MSLMWQGGPYEEALQKEVCSISYAWIAYEKRTKLDPKKKKMMITGYNNNHKYYRLVDFNTNQLSFSRHLVVDEESMGPSGLL